ncbi:MAG: amidohydrolase family protein [Deltaproteobacteria bacterium]|nr:MAG: amidohydrolase family protein [Deltaproteobacteria bacterium]
MRTRLVWICLLLLAGFFFFLMVGRYSAAAELYFIDAHSQADQHIDFEEILSLMDKAGISRTILSLRGRRQPEELISFASRHPDRITPAVRTKGGAYLKGAKQFNRFLDKQIQMHQFGAMAEVLLWHAKKEKAPSVTLGSGKKGKPPQVVVPPDDPRIQVALNKVREKGWPFVAHIEFAAIGESKNFFMKKFENLLRKNTDHPFVLMHMGELDTTEARRLIENHSNIHFNTAMSNPIAVKRSAQPLVNLFKGTRLAPVWKDLFALYPDRFILGFDNVFAGHWRKLYVKQAALWRKALQDLPEDLAHSVAHGNAERLWKVPHRID